jgi:flavin-dependent dehydrogenase
VSDAVIVGGGLAGGAFATLLARQGRRVQLIERSAEPADKVCGEFFSGGASDALTRLGLDLDRLGASRIDAMRLAWGSRTLDVALPFVARGVSRRCIDAALLELAEGTGARVDRGVTVRSIDGRHVETSAGRVTAAIVGLASGKHDVRGTPRHVAGCETGYIGFKTHWRLRASARAAIAGKVSVTLFDGGYAGLQLVENGMANLCLLARKATVAAAGGDWPGVLAMLLREPELARLLGDAEQISPKPLAIAGVPYGFLNRAPVADGVFRLGDQTAVIPSFCGEGMAIALHSAHRAAAMIAAGAGSEDYQQTMAREFAAPVGRAMQLQRHALNGWPRHLLWAALRTAPGLGRYLVHSTRVGAAEERLAA